MQISVLFPCQEFHGTETTNSLKFPLQRAVSVSSVVQSKLTAFHHLTEPRCSGRDWRLNPTNPSKSHVLLRLQHKSSHVHKGCLFKSLRKTSAKAQYVVPQLFSGSLPFL